VDYPWGAVRPGPNNALPTGYTFTGQLDSGLGLMYYGARFYDGALGRFISPDTIVPEPGNPQALNRYSYVLNNPLRYTDPTGMFSEDEIEQYLRGNYGDLWRDYWNAWRSDDVFWNMLLEAQYQDVLWAPTSGLGAGIFVNSGSTFTLLSEHELYQYQGMGPYFLNNNPGTAYTGHPLDGSGVANRRWEQPQYEYVSGKAPRYTGYNRVVQYQWTGEWSIDPSAGSGMPYIVGASAQLWRLLAKRYAAALLCPACTTFLTELTAAMAVNNMVLLEYSMQVDSRPALSPTDRLKTWYQLLYPEFSAQPS
jgi:RHS repeat-associated protein